MLDCHTFVLGALDETADEVKETLAFVDRLDPAVAVFIVFMEDRGTMTVHRARPRDAILELLPLAAPKRRGGIVPALRFPLLPTTTHISPRPSLPRPTPPP